MSSATLRVEQTVPLRRGRIAENRERLEDGGYDEDLVADLRLAPQPRARRRPTIAYALIALAGVGAIGAIQLGISLSLAQGSYEIASLTNQSVQLGRSTQALQEKLTVLESPQYLAEAATKLGMQSSAETTFIELSDGKQVATVKTLSDAYQRIANNYAISISGNLVANSNLTGTTNTSVISTSAVGATQGKLGSAFGSLLSLLPQGSTNTAAAASITGSTTGSTGSGAAEKSQGSGVASASPGAGELSLADNQMPAPHSR